MKKKGMLVVMSGKRWFEILGKNIDFIYFILFVVEFPNKIWKTKRTNRYTRIFPKENEYIRILY